MGIKLDQKTGSYVVSVCKRHPVTRVPCRKQKVVSGSRKEAERVERQLLQELERQQQEELVPTVAEVVRQWEQSVVTQGRYMKSTLNAYKKCIEAHIIPLWGKRSVDSVSSVEIREAVLDEKHRWSQAHRKNMLKYVRAVFSFAEEKGFIQKSLVPKMKFRVVQSLKGGLTEEQASQLLQQARDVNCEWYPHWALALFTGMRTGELYALKWDCINFEAMSILVRETWNKKDGFKPPKSWEERRVPIAKDAVLLLQELKLQTYETGFVLPRLDEWDKGEQARELRMFLQGMGLPRMRFHDLRASWATILLSRGVVPIQVMRMGGWKDLKTMEKYVRIAGVDVQGATDCLKFYKTKRQDAQVVSFEARKSAGSQL